MSAPPAPRTETIPARPTAAAFPAPPPADPHATRVTVTAGVAPPPAPSAAPPPAPGYVVRGELGRGGMGVVFEAVAVGLNRPVALKFLPELDAHHPEHLARFRDEAEAVGRLNHPNVVQIFELGDAGGRAFLALELVTGGSLADRLRAGPLPVAEAVRLVGVVAAAVQHAHDRGVLHRDLKPGNVLLSGGTVPKLTDFGLAKFLDADRSRTRTGAAIGTPAYMAPEIAAGGHRTAGPAADVYGLGAVLYECLTARPPAVGENNLETLLAVVYDDPPPPRTLRPEVPADLETICLKALAKAPADRYPSAGALADDLARVAAGERVRTARPRPRRRRGLARRLVAGAWAAVGVLLLAAAFDARTRYRDGTAAGRSAGISSGGGRSPRPTTCSPAG